MIILWISITELNLYHLQYELPSTYDMYNGMQVKNISESYNININININFTVGWKLKKLSWYLIIKINDLIVSTKLLLIV